MTTCEARTQMAFAARTRRFLAVSSARETRSAREDEQALHRCFGPLHPDSM